MVKNKEFEYCSWNQNEWGWNFQNDWIRPLWYAFLRHLESYYCILRWKNWIRGSFYKKKKNFRGGKKLSRWRPQWVGRVTGTTSIFLFGLMLKRPNIWESTTRWQTIQPVNLLRGGAGVVVEASYGGCSDSCDRYMYMTTYPHHIHPRYMELKHHFKVTKSAAVQRNTVMNYCTPQYL
jgi:hypothetical protein